MSKSVLFVCLGNICRSPTAEGVFRLKVAESKLANASIIIDSAGTGAWHAGNPADSRAQAAALARGYDLSSIRARQVKSSDFDRFDYILAMDSDNLDHLEGMSSGADYSGYLGRFLDFAPAARKDVPDPYYGGADGFETVLDLIEQASEGLITHIIQQS
ncbi:low molecular weight protein-tyrosine-phosphatase [Halioxenophilus aromaticivorans]|uniref:protein-tyrosine-phosphatase n=1 Tax=Halioxenophilus aromaticivorans TaxID=1306992 RepID=A0AAV3TWQ3_9ALTE